MDDDGENVHSVQDSDAVQPDIQQGMGALWEGTEKQVKPMALGLGGSEGPCAAERRAVQKTPRARCAQGAR